MAESRVVMPETVVLPISNGDTLTIKKRLTTGEHRARLARMYTQHNGSRVLDPMQVGVSTVLAYLLDWSLVGLDGKQISIRDQPADVVQSALDSLDPDDFKEIRQAIEQHEAKVDAERAKKKMTQAGATSSEATSASPSNAAGATSGSPSSTPTSTAS